MALKKDDRKVKILPFPLGCRVAISAWKCLNVDSRIRFGEMVLDLTFPKVKAFLSTDPSQMLTDIRNNELNPGFPQQLCDSTSIQRRNTSGAHATGTVPQLIERNLGNCSQVRIHDEHHTPIRFVAVRPESGLGGEPGGFGALAALDFDVDVEQ